MSYTVPPSKASIKQNRFEITVPDYDENGEPIPGTEVEYSLPKMQYVNADLKERMVTISAELKAVLDDGRKPEPAQAAELLKITRELFETYAPGLFARVTDDQLQDLQKAWQEASNISVGESSASAD